MTSSTSIAKIDKQFHNWLMEVARKRYYTKKEAKLQSIKRMTRALMRHPSLPIIEKDLIWSDFIKDERGQIESMGLFQIGIIVFIALALFSGLIWVMGMLNTTFHNAGLSNEVNAGQPGYVNMTLAGEQIFGKLNESIQGLRLVALAMIFSIILYNIVVNSFARVHPVFFIVHVFIVLLAIFLAVPISNAYESVLNAMPFDNMMSTFGAGNYFMLHLPTFIGLIGILGGMFMFFNIVRGGNETVLR